MLVFCISQFLLISTLLCWWNTTKEWKKNCKRHLSALPVSESELSGFAIACVASVSVWFRSKGRPRNTGFSVLATREMKQQPKNESGGRGRGRGRKETLSDKPLDFENLRLISPTTLTCVDQRFVSYWEEGMVGDTYISFQWLLFILVGKICPPKQEHFLWLDLFWNVRLALRLNKGFRSFNLIWITKSDFLLFSNAMVSCKVSCWAQLVSVFLRDVEFSQMVIYRLFC